MSYPTEINRDTVINFFKTATKLKSKGDEQNVSAVLSVSVLANRELFKEVQMEIILDEEAKKDISMIFGFQKDFERLEAQMYEYQAREKEYQTRETESQQRETKYREEIEALKAENARLKENRGK